MEVAEIVQQIRADEDLDNLAESLKRNIMLPDHSSTKSAEGELSNLIGRPSLDAAGVVKHYGHTSGLGLVSNGEQSPIHIQTSEPWTKVSQNTSLIDHLMTLYFTWSHPFYTFFSKELFLHHMTTNQSKYCSPLLVNAILSLACAYSDRPESRANPPDPRTAGDHFFAEAKRLLQEDESSNLTTVQALAVMGLREASCSRDSSGFQYAGRCTRMLLELGLHVSFGAAGDDIGPTELEARNITFWGCFVVETAWAICVGRISQLPRAAINIDPPSIQVANDTKPWQSYNDSGLASAPQAEQPILNQTAFYQLSLLSEIVSDTDYMFYAPRERFTSKKLLDFKSRYNRWYNQLPDKLRLRDDSLPHVLVLHMYYHTVVLHLFRPFLKVDLTTSSVSPREICTSCANNIVSILSTYRQMYGVRLGTVLMTHIILSSSIIHLLNLPNASAARDLTFSIDSLREMSTSHAFAKRCILVVIKLAKQWNIDLPPEVFTAAEDVPGDSAVKSNTAQSSPRVDSNVLPVPESIHAQHQGHLSVRNAANQMPFAPTKYSPRAFSQPTDLFWSPFPDSSLPLHAHHQGGLMDIAAMVDVPNEWDQLNRDGFRVASPNVSRLG
ncbi:hypothetical protein ACLMJK_007078 [Lecanora helva]